jgi:sigma-54 specific flagellar transcriptional regulator A
MLLAATAVPMVSNFPSLIHGSDSPIVELLAAVARIAPTDSTVMLTGETGTGKEVFARHIHDSSPRARKNFVPVNCGAIPETLLESELFGHVRGAFTGAVQSRKGRVAMADGGTLFLDEIGEMPVSLQVKLLRLLQERTYEPVGSAESTSANFRLIAATNRNLAAEVDAGRFRRDLFYRLQVCPLELPPLRARRNDVVALFHHFWSQRGETRTVEPAAMRAIVLHPWPGNVRELENMVERVSVCTEGPVIRLSDLPSHIRQAALGSGELAASNLTLIPPPLPTMSDASPHPAPSPATNANAAPIFEPLPSSTPPLQRQVPLPDQLLASAARPSFPIDLPALLRNVEDLYIAAALDTARGNRKAAADLLGLQRTTLVEKLRRRQKDALPATG